MINSIQQIITKGLLATEIKVNAGIQAAQTRLDNFYNAECDELAKLNDGLRPTISSAGLHAPFDGYYAYDDEPYLKGQFIPTRDNDEYQKGGAKVVTSKARIKLPIVLEEFLNNTFENLVNGNAVIGKGKSWDENGVEVAYFYIEAGSAYIDTLTRIYDGEIAAIVRKNAVGNKGESPKDRQTIRGEVLSIKIEDGYYAVKTVVTIKLENNSTVWGTLPAKIDSANVGDIIELTATFTQADCGTHSFYKRPTKASIVKFAETETTES